MEAVGELNELLTTKMCSPVIIYGVVLVVSIISVYISRQALKRFNTQKMENLYNLYTMQELKFMIILGVIMYGLCQYNKTELAWIFLIFPVIYVLIQNALLYIHVSSAIQSAPAEQPMMQSQHYGTGMSGPLLGGQGPSPPQITSSPPQTVISPPPTQAQPSQPEFSLPKMTNQSNSMGGGFGSSGSGMEPSGFNL